MTDLAQNEMKAKAGLPEHVSSNEGLGRYVNDTSFSEDFEDDRGAIEVRKPRVLPHLALKVASVDSDKTTVPRAGHALKSFRRRVHGTPRCTAVRERFIGNAPTCKLSLQRKVELRIGCDPTATNKRALG